MIRRVLRWCAAFACIAACTSYGGAEDATPAPDRDAGDDASAANDAGDTGSASCAHLFCASFDDGAPLVGTWSTVEATDGGSLVIDTMVSRSAPGSLLSSLPGQDGGSSWANVGFETPTHAVTHVKLSFDVLLPADLPPVFADLAGFYVVDDTTTNDKDGWHFNIQAGNGSFHLHQFPPSDVTPRSAIESPDFALARAKFVHVDVEVFSSPGNGRVVGTVEGVRVAESALGSPFRPGRVRIFVGISYGIFSFPPFAIHWDNVTLDVE
jgi:hypothetical protein